MKQYNVTIKLNANDDNACLMLGNLLQNAVNVVEYNDMVKLLTKVKQNPRIVKTAVSLL